jgi:hypothetical protein
MQQIPTSLEPYLIPPARPVPLPRSLWFKVMGVCALVDSERHLGHAVRERGVWLAYDAVHPNASHDGFLCLGRFKTAADARRAIETSVDAAHSSNLRQMV